MFLFQRYKSIQPGAEEKIINRKVPRAKLRECIQDDSFVVLGTPKASIPNGSAALKSVPSKTISSQTVQHKNKITSSSNKMIRKNVSNETIDKSQNTIRSMFLSQLEKQKEAATKANASINSDHGSSMSKASFIFTTPKKLTTSSDKSIAGTKTPNQIIVPGSAHKRLTRRNSMIITEYSPAKVDQMDATNVDSTTVDGPKTPKNKLRRRTMFTPTRNLQAAIEEEADDDLNKMTNGDDSQMAKVTAKLPVMQKTAALCDNLSKTDSNNFNDKQSCNNKTLTFSNGSNTIDETQLSKVDENVSMPGRRTIYTVIPMEETIIPLPTHKTPIRRRSTMHFNGGSCIDKSDLFETTSCDAVLSPSIKTPFLGKRFAIKQF